LIDRSRGGADNLARLASGLGLQLHAYQEFHHWDRFATVLCCILIVVTLLDLLSERIRQRIARRLPADSAHLD